MAFGKGLKHNADNLEKERLCSFFFGYSPWRTTPMQFFSVIPCGVPLQCIFFGYSQWRTTPEQFFSVIPCGVPLQCIFFGYSLWRTTPVQFFLVIPRGVPLQCSFFQLFPVAYHLCIATQYNITSSARNLR